MPFELVDDEAKTSKFELVEDTQTKTTAPELKPQNAFQLYMNEAQPAFKYAVTGNLESQNKPWADIYREANLPFSKSKSMVGQMIPELAGDLLEFGTKPSSYIAPKVISKGLGAMANNPATRRFLQTQTPTLAKKLLAENPMQPVYKTINDMQVDITKPLPPTSPKLVKTGKKIVDSVNEVLDSMGKQYNKLVGKNPLTSEEVSSVLPSKIAKKIGIKISEIKTTEDLWQARTDLSKTVSDPWSKAELLKKTNLKEEQVMGLMNQMKALTMNKMDVTARQSLEILDSEFTNAQAWGKGIVRAVYNPATKKVNTTRLVSIFKNPAEQGSRDLFNQFSYFDKSINALSQSVKNYIAKRAFIDFTKKATVVTAGVVAANKYVREPLLRTLNGME